MAKQTITICDLCQKKDIHMITNERMSLFSIKGEDVDLCCDCCQKLLEGMLLEAAGDKVVDALSIAFEQMKSTPADKE